MRVRARAALLNEELLSLGLVREVRAVVVGLCRSSLGKRERRKEEAEEQQESLHPVSVVASSQRATGRDRSHIESVVVARVVGM